MKTGTKAFLLSLLFSGSTFAQHWINPTVIAEDDVRRDIPNFFRETQHDFNEDRKRDILICRNEVISGKNRLRVIMKNDKIGNSNEFYNWVSPEWMATKNINYYGPKVAKIYMSGCDVAEISPGKKSIVISTHYAHPSLGARIRGPQIVLLKHKNHVNRYTMRRLTLPDSNTIYGSAARSVNCTKYPAHLARSMGTSQGALCFFAGYDSSIGHGSYYGTTTALLKLEHGDNNRVITRDITGTSGLPWHGGARGTDYTTIPTKKICNGPTKYDGLHMMEGEFIDYNRDGLPDLVTVGQHASMKSHTMIFDSSKPQGIRFQNITITDSRTSNMTEFLTVQALNEKDNSLQTSCVYVTGEVNNINNLSCGDVRDHMRCFRNGQWEEKHFPGRAFSSRMQGSTTKRNGRGKIVVGANSFANNGSFIETKFFKMSGAAGSEIKLNVGNIVERSNHVIVRGWACLPNTRQLPEIVISNQRESSNRYYKEFYRGRTSILAEDGVQRICQQPDEQNYRFHVRINRSEFYRNRYQDGRLFIRARVNGRSDKVVTKNY